MATVSDADGGHDHVNDVLQQITNGETGNGVADPSYKLHDSVAKQEAHDDLEGGSLSQNALAGEATNADALSGKENLVEATINHTQESHEPTENDSTVDDAAQATPDQVAVPEFDSLMDVASQLNSVEVLAEVVPQEDEQSLQYEDEESVATEATLDVTDDAQVQSESAVDEAALSNTKVFILLVNASPASSSWPHTPHLQDSSPATFSAQDEISASVEADPVLANAEMSSYAEDTSVREDPAVAEVDEILSGSANVEESTEDLAEIAAPQEVADKVEATVAANEAAEEKIYAEFADTVNEVSLDSEATLLDAAEVAVPVEEEPIHMEEPVSPLVPRAPEAEEPPIAVEETVTEVQPITEASVPEPVEATPDASETVEEVIVQAAESLAEVPLETARDVSEPSSAQPFIDVEAVVDVPSAAIKEGGEVVQVPESPVQTPVADATVVELVAEDPIVESSEVLEEVTVPVAVQEEEVFLAEPSEDVAASESRPITETVTVADDIPVEPLTEDLKASEVVEEVTPPVIVEEEETLTESVEDLTVSESHVIAEEAPIEPTVEESAVEEQEPTISAAGDDTTASAIPDASEASEQVIDSAIEVTEELPAEVSSVTPPESQSIEPTVKDVVPDASEAIEKGIASTAATQEEPPTELLAEDLAVEEAQDPELPIPAVDIAPEPVTETFTVESHDSAVIVEEQTPVESAEVSSDPSSETATTVETAVAMEDVIAELKPEEQAVEELESSSNAADVQFDIITDSAVEDSEGLSNVVPEVVSFSDVKPTEPSLVEDVTPLADSAGEAPEADSFDNGSSVAEPAEVVPESIAILDTITDAEIPVVEATQSFTVTPETPAFLSADGITADSVVPVEEPVEASSEEPTESGPAIQENVEAVLPVELELLPEPEPSFSSINADILEESPEAEPVPVAEDIAAAITTEQSVTEEAAPIDVEHDQGTSAATDAPSETEAPVLEAETITSSSEPVEAVEIPIKDEDVEGDLKLAQDSVADVLITDSQVSEEEIAPEDTTIPLQEESVLESVAERDAPLAPMTDTIDSGVDVVSTVKSEAASVDEAVADSIDKEVEETAAAPDVVALEETEDAAIEEQLSAQPSELATATVESQTSVAEPELTIVESAVDETLPIVPSDTPDVAVETISEEKVDAVEEVLGAASSESEVNPTEVDIVESEKSTDDDEIQVAAIEAVVQSEEGVSALTSKEEVSVAEQVPQEIKEVDTIDVEEATEVIPDGADETETSLAVEQSTATEGDKAELDLVEEAVVSHDETRLPEPEPVIADEVENARPEAEIQEVISNIHSESAETQESHDIPSAVDLVQSQFNEVSLEAELHASGIDDVPRDEEVHVQEPIIAEELDVVQETLATEHQSEPEDMRDITTNSELSPELNIREEQKSDESEIQPVDIPEPSMLAPNVQATTEDGVVGYQFNESVSDVQPKENSEGREQTDEADKEIPLSASLHIATEIERPKSPWTPSYSVTTQGPGISDKAAVEGEVQLSAVSPAVVVSEEAGIEPNNELPAASDSEESGKVFLPTLIITPQAVRPGESLLGEDGSESRPRSPWTPSYSVMRQGSVSPRIPEVELPPTVVPEKEEAWTPSYSVTRQGSVSPRIPEVELPPSVVPEKDEPTISAEVPLIVASETVSEPLEALVADKISDEHSAPAIVGNEVVDVLEETNERQADEVNVVESHPTVILEREVQTTEPESSITPSASLLTAQEEPVIDRPKSPWTPSYSVTRQGTGLSDVEAGHEEAELDKLEQLPEPITNAPEQDTPAANGINGARTHTDSEPSLGGFSSQNAAAAAEIPVTPEVKIYSVEDDENTESCQTFPTAEDSEDAIHKLSQKPSLATVDELNSTDGPSLHIEIPTSASSRKRLESTTSSRFFPGGWFSSSPKVPEEGRTSLDVAAGEFISKSAETTPTTPMPTAVEEDSEKKARWCTIM
ncbi:hypothetical protein SERLA73DRAFT_73309 [Serpula lacrymans var. lacrymans S7.3]|uniref:Uncharacterized protein n=1 Tax=Serpula lacrymans var. lacrymans (strain S7.3) TaxID=936435 RepID=F8PXU4_SERL3|nr:hypothetical protein SERLA73DRAFT_73309 [Serpula lacrymans var. lacrymans S7.3]